MLRFRCCVIVLRPGVWIRFVVAYAEGSVGSLTHLSMALFLKRAGLDMTNVSYRGNAPGDRSALIAALVNLGRLARDLCDIIESVDINPFLVCRQGEGAFALDGLVALRPPGAAS